MDTPSLRLMAFYYAHPEKMQFIRNVNWEYWHCYHKLGIGRGYLADKWGDVLDYVNQEFPSVYDEIEKMSGCWDTIDREEFERDGYS